MVEDIITAMSRFKSLMSQTVRTESGRRSKLFIVLVKGEGGIKDRVFASGLRCSRGSYRQHATKDVDVNKGDPSGSNESL
jgi:hypothetical protein